MQVVSGIVRNIAIVILLATFMELLLPNSSMRRFVQLVMGLFVLSAVLGPLMQLLDRPLAFEIPAWSQYEAGGSQTELAQVLQQGEGIRDKAKEAALAEYKKVVERQAKALALTVKGVEQVALELTVKADGQVENLKVYVGGQETEIQPVEPVNGLNKPKEISPNPKPAENQTARDLKARLGTLLAISEEKIQVYFRDKQ